MRHDEHNTPEPMSIVDKRGTNKKPSPVREFADREIASGIQEGIAQAQAEMEAKRKANNERKERTVAAVEEAIWVELERQGIEGTDQLGTKPPWISRPLSEVVGHVDMRAVAIAACSAFGAQALMNIKATAEEMRAVEEAQKANRKPRPGVKPK